MAKKKPESPIKDPLVDEDLPDPVDSDVEPNDVEEAEVPAEAEHVDQDQDSDDSSVEGADTGDGTEAGERDAQPVEPQYKPGEVPRNKSRPIL